MIITQSAQLCGNTYDIPSGIIINASNIVFDCDGAILRGNAGESNTGLKITDATNVTIQGCNIVTFDQGIMLRNVTHSEIKENSILKNRIGIRLLDAFENIIANNNDKSHQLPVSAINSRFNTVMLSNRNIEREFCEVNSCNTKTKLNPCVASDFYCSSKCTYESDADCPKPKEEQKKEETAPIIEKIPEQIEQKNTTVEQKEANEQRIPFIAKAFILFALYGIAFLLLRLRR